MTGDTRAAAASFRLTRETIEVMANADPQNRMLQLDLAGIDYEDGRALATMGQYDKAIALLEAALRRFEGVQTRLRPAGDTPHDRGAILIWLGDAYAARQNLRLALRSF